MGCVDGAFEGVEEMVEGTSALVFLGAMVGDRGSLEVRGNIYVQRSRSRPPQGPHCTGKICILVKRKLN
jgi:hypothetical protein